MWVLGMKPRFSSRAVSLLTTVPTVQPHFLIVFLYMGVSPACTAVHHSWRPQRPEKGAGGPGTGATFISLSVGAENLTWVLRKRS